MHPQSGSSNTSPSLLSSNISIAISLLFEFSSAGSYFAGHASLTFHLCIVFCDSSSNTTLASALLKVPSFTCECQFDKLESAVYPRFRVMFEYFRRPSSLRECGSRLAAWMLYRQFELVSHVPTMLLTGMRLKAKNRQPSNY